MTGKETVRVVWVGKGGGGYKRGGGHDLNTLALHKLITEHLPGNLRYIVYTRES